MLQLRQQLRLQRGSCRAQCGCKRVQMRCGSCAGGGAGKFGLLRLRMWLRLRLQKKGRRTYHGQNLSRTALRRVRRSGGRSDDRNGRRMHDVQYGGCGCQCKRRRIRFLLCSSVWIVSLQCDQYLRLRQLTLSEKGGGSLRIRLRFLWLIISLRKIWNTFFNGFRLFSALQGVSQRFFNILKRCAFFRKGNKVFLDSLKTVFKINFYIKIGQDRKIW